jgi:hypothetical protein
MPHINLVLNPRKLLLLRVKIRLLHRVIVLKLSAQEKNPIIPIIFQRVRSSLQNLLQI